MAGARKKENSQELVKFLKSIQDDKTYKEIARGISFPEEEIRKIFEGERVPSYNVLSDILVYLGINPDVIKKLSENDGVLLFKYWDDLYPDEEHIEHIRDVIKEIMYEKNIEHRQVVKNFGTASSYVSAMLSGLCAVSYNSLVRFAEALEETPVSILYRLKGRTKIQKCKNQFEKKLKQVRMENEWSIEDAANICQLTPYKYSKIEQGEVKLEIRTLLRICKRMKLDIEEIGNLAIEGKILLDKDSLKEAIQNKRKYIITKSACEKDLEEELFKICRYKKLSMNSKIYETHNVITLIFMILASEIKTKEKYKHEIIFYLKKLKEGEKGDIYKPLMIYSIPNNEDGTPATMSQIFTYYRNELGYSFAEIAKLSGLSKGYISNRNQKNDFHNIRFIDKVFTSVQIPMSVGVEMMIKDKTEKIGKNNLEEIISVNKLILAMKETTIWTFWKERISLDTLTSIFKIIYGSGDAVMKYTQIKNLPLPEKYNDSEFEYRERESDFE